MSHDGVAFINGYLASFDTNTNLMKDGFYHHDINIVLSRLSGITTGAGRATAAAATSTT